MKEHNIGGHTFYLAPIYLALVCVGMVGLVYAPRCINNPDDRAEDLGPDAWRHNTNKVDAGGLVSPQAVSEQHGAASPPASRAGSRVPNAWKLSVIHSEQADHALELLADHACDSEAGHQVDHGSETQTGSGPNALSVPTLGDGTLSLAPCASQLSYLLLSVCRCDIPHPACERSSC